MALIGSQKWPAVGGLYTSFAVEHKAQGKEAGCNKKNIHFNGSHCTIANSYFFTFCKIFLSTFKYKSEYIKIGCVNLKTAAICIKRDRVSYCALNL